MYAVLVGGRSGKFGVVVLKVSMLDWEVDLPVHHTMFCVAVLKASMLEWGVDLPNLV